MSPNQLRTFFSKAAAYLNNPRFQAAEVSYKLHFQGELRPAMEAYRTGDRHALQQLTRALRSPNQNMINWRLVQPFLGWCKRHPSNARTALKSLWFGNGSVEKRFRRFAAELGAAGMSQPGEQLSITSTLLMGLSARKHPPIRTRTFKVVFPEAGYPPFQPNQDATARYAHALRFLNVLIERAPKYGVRLQHRLVAQGVVWCLGGGWKRSGEFDDRTIEPEDDVIDEAEAALAESELAIRRGVPYDVERFHILRAIKTIDRRGVPTRRESTRYDLIHQDKPYPPKYLISLAHTFVDGSEWPASAFSGGEESNNFLISRGFRIADRTGRAVSIQPVVEDDAESFPEGREKYALHRSQERNARISRMAKERRLAETGDLRCDVCRFSFSQRYGGRGQGFVEAHHTIPVSELRRGSRTRVNDIALVCSNCHRMLHRRRPWLTMDQLRMILR